MKNEDVKKNKMDIERAWERLKKKNYRPYFTKFMSVTLYVKF